MWVKPVPMESLLPTGMCYTYALGSSGVRGRAGLREDDEMDMTGQRMSSLRKRVQ